MEKCSQCGKKYKSNGTFLSIFGAQFSFEISMIAFGMYSAVCYHMLKSIYLFIASLVISGIILYALDSISSRQCESCSEKYNDK